MTTATMQTTNAQAATTVFDLFSAEHMSAELDRAVARNRSLRIACGIAAGVVVALFAALIAFSLFATVLQARGDHMSPGIAEGDLLVTVPAGAYQAGDVVAFDYGNMTLVKRVVALPGDVVDMDDRGTVAVNGVTLREDYAQDLHLGQADMAFPYEVPAGSFFVLGDNRGAATDSRHSALGAVSQERVIGKVVAKVWPIASIGSVG